MYQIALYMGLLLLLGLVVMYALGPQRANVLNHAYGTHYSDTFFFNKQFVSVVTAVVAFAVCAAVPYRWFTDHARKIFLIGLLASLLLVVCGAVLHLSFATETNGAYRWFYLGGLGSFQPSELLKFGVLLFAAGFLGQRAGQGKINSLSDTLIPLAVVVGVALMTIVVLQKDLGTGVSLVALVLAVLVVSGMSWRVIGKIAGILVIGAVLLTVFSPHRIERVMTFFQGDSHQTTQNDDNNYHIQQARIAIGSGGLFGLGIGKSVQATGYLPEAINDSICHHGRDFWLGRPTGYPGLIHRTFVVATTRRGSAARHAPTIDCRWCVRLGGFACGAQRGCDDRGGTADRYTLAAA